MQRSAFSLGAPRPSSLPPLLSPLPLPTLPLLQFSLLARARSPRNARTALPVPILRTRTTRQHLTNLRGEAFNDEALQLSILAFVFDEKLLPVVFEEVFATHTTDLLDNEEEDGFGDFGALDAVPRVVADVAAGYIRGTVSGEGDAVGELLAPACDDNVSPCSWL